MPLKTKGWQKATRQFRPEEFIAPGRELDFHQVQTTRHEHDKQIIIDSCYLRLHTKSIPQLWTQQCILACFNLWCTAFSLVYFHKKSKSREHQRASESHPSLVSFFTFPPFLPSRCPHVSCGPHPISLTWHQPWILRGRDVSKIKRESTPGRGKGYRPSQCKVPLIWITLSISKYSIFSLERCSRLSATHAATIARNGPYLSSWQKCIQKNKFRKLFWQLNQPCFKWTLQQEVNHGVLMPTIRLWFVLSCRTPWCRMAVVIVEPFRALCMARLCCDIRQRNDRATLRHDWPKSSV